MAYKADENNITVNPVRPVETNLDKYPFPLRSPLKEYALGKKFATILAGRGCNNNCTYCFLREYTRQSSGPHKRIRNPAMVVVEMELLHKEMDCSVFLFQDDDFPVSINTGSEWIGLFCHELKLRNLSGNIMWKINCRPDEVESDTFAMMKNHGLFLVYLGLEDGTDRGLERLNKNMTVAESIEGIDILKRLAIGVDYGFMLFQPESTFGSVNENIDFLGKICADGLIPVSFMKMMPYSWTIAGRELYQSGRLKGKPGFLDYTFHEKSLDLYYEFVEGCFREWLMSGNGLLNLTKWARNYQAVFKRFYDPLTEISTMSEELNGVISESNLFMLDILKEQLYMFESGKFANGNSQKLKLCRNMIHVREKYYKKKISDILAGVVARAHYQKFLHPRLY